MLVCFCFAAGYARSSYASYKAGLYRVIMEAERFASTTLVRLNQKQASKE